MKRITKSITAAALTLTLLAPTTPANATEHLVEMIEVFSDESGAFQFVNLRIQSSGQNNQSLAFLESAATGNTLPLIDFPSDTANRQILIGTAAVEDALGFTNGIGSTGVDVLMPDNFFDYTQDTLSYKLTPFDPTTGHGSFFDFDLPSGAHQSWGPDTPNTLPTDNIHSLVFGFHDLGLDPHDHVGLPAHSSPQNFHHETGSVSPPPTAPPTELTVTIHGTTTQSQVVSYSNQDRDQANVTIEDDGATLNLSGGDAWKKITLDAPLTITPNTTLEFDFSSTAQGELHGIGFDSDDTVNNNNEQQFKVFGTANAFPSVNFDFQDYPREGNLGDTIHYSINVGQFFTDTVSSINFFTDNDASPNLGQSVFSNITISDHSTPPVPEPSSLAALLTAAALTANRKKRPKST